MGKSSTTARGGSSSTSNRKQPTSSTTTNSNNNKRGRGTTDDDTTMFSKKKKATSSTAGSSSMMVEPTSPSPSSTETAIMDMFKVIAEDPSDPNSQANLDGITILGEKIGIDAAEDIRILILLWKLGVGITQNPTPTPSSSNKYSRSNSNPKPQTPQYNSNFIPGTIQASEWKYGCQNILHVDSWESLAAIKPSLDVGFLDTGEFRDFYKFCFRFNLNGTHKTLDNETAVALLQMIFGASSGRIDPVRFDTFIQFLEDPEKAKAYSKITLDQWMSFYDFCQEIPNNDELLNSSLYDESTSAWPVLLDDYVDYIQQMKKG